MPDRDRFYIGDCSHAEVDSIFRFRDFGCGNVVGLTAAVLTVMKLDILFAPHIGLSRCNACTCGIYNSGYLNFVRRVVAP